jgi:hypothetical protein
MMQTVSDYLNKTESAVKRLFDGIDAYLDALRQEPGVVYSYRKDEDPWDAYDRWASEKPEKLKASLEARRRFVAEGFALATLCGSVLQIAAKAIECYSVVDEVPKDCDDLLRMRGGSRVRSFCIGRRVHDVPVGLVIYAGRNQATHFNEEKLNDANIEIFRRLCTGNPLLAAKGLNDPAFDLARSNMTNFASNITALLGWRSFEAYDADMRALLIS